MTKRGDMRTETDSLGDISVPKNAMYGAQTQRALNNFKLSNLCFQTSFIMAIVQIKKAAAQVNSNLNCLAPELAEGIVNAANDVLENVYSDQFPVDVFQTGSGTSTNMNVNEVIAGICRKRYGLDVHPNDHVNLGQSSNDVIPTAIQVSSALEITSHLLPPLNDLISIIDLKSDELKHVIKYGRTHLMDAVPISFGQELSGWSSQLHEDVTALEGSLQLLTNLAQGGTAVGTGVNTHPEFAKCFADQLSDNLASTTDLQFSPSDNFFRSISSQNLSVNVSGQLRVLAISLFKISTDLRWMNSGPLAGLSEIQLEALQPGSSIMPGKINPVIPEAVSMACAQVIGNDATISMAGMSGNFQLNTMLPVIAYNLLQSIELLGNAANHLGCLSIKSFKVDTQHIEKSLRSNPMLATALAPIIGYEAAVNIANKAYKTNQSVLEIAKHETDIEERRLIELLNPLNQINLD